MQEIKLNGLDQFAAVMRRLAYGAYKRRLVGLLRLIGQRVKTVARQSLGQYNGGYGPYPAWAALAPSTILTKRSQGWGKGGNPNTPLYATGAMANSFGFRVNKSELSVTVGTSAPYAVYHELGTVDMPPRPFLGPAALRVVRSSLPEIAFFSGVGIVGLSGDVVGTFRAPQYGSVAISNIEESI